MNSVNMWMVLMGANQFLDAFLDYKNADLRFGILLIFALKSTANDSVHCLTSLKFLFLQSLIVMRVSITNLIVQFVSKLLSAKM